MKARVEPPAQPMRSARSHADTHRRGTTVARQGLRRWLGAVGTVAAVVVLPAAPALAHVSLAEAEPAEGLTVTDMPAAVALTFDAALAAGGDHAVGLFAPDGVQVDDGQTTELTDRSVQVGVGELPDVGAYTVRWLVVGADGHTIEGDYTFTYDGPVVTVGTPSEASPPATAEAASEAPAEVSETASEEAAVSPSPEADPTEVTATPAAAEPDAGGGALVPAAVGVAAVLGVGAVLLHRRNGPPANGPPA